MALSMDFHSAADIILTMPVPTWQAPATLGGIVPIRTVVHHFFTRENKD
jgi:uncharacterized membrane protein